jgi:hypothetical protein
MSMRLLAPVNPASLIEASLITLPRAM